MKKWPIAKVSQIWEISKEFFFLKHLFKNYFLKYQIIFDKFYDKDLAIAGDPAVFCIPSEEAR